jgi:hypothetical protein
VACGEGAEDLEGGRGDDSYVQGSGIFGIYSDSECRSVMADEIQQDLGRLLLG